MKRSHCSSLKRSSSGNARYRFVLGMRTVIKHAEEGAACDRQILADWFARQASLHTASPGDYSGSPTSTCDQSISETWSRCAARAARLEPFDVLTDLDDLARHLHARGEGRRRGGLVFAADHQRISEIDAGGMDGNSHFVRPGPRRRQVGQLDDLQAANSSIHTARISQRLSHRQYCPPKKPSLPANARGGQHSSAVTLHTTNLC